jgi:hypothetical protein
MLELTQRDSAKTSSYAKQGRNFVLPTQKRQPKDGIWLSKGDT